MKKNKISKSWLRKQYKDPFFKKSKIEGYRSRSAYKLIEINKKFNFLKKDTYLLDLGSSPGGWAQVARKKITKGKIMALDVKDMKKIDDVYFMKIDIANLEICNKISFKRQFFSRSFAKPYFRHFANIRKKKD